uniref:Patched family protein n=1 Tax=Parascaris equorum TaxID=6256 RepID=A0A914RY86_PAREQ
MGAIDALERFIAGFFSKIGLFIGSHPLCVILCVTVATLFLSVGLVNFKEVNNVRTEYSPINAPSRIEYAIAKNFLGQNGTMDPSYIMVQARDGGSLLRDDYRRMLISLTKRLQNNVTVTYNGHTYGYIDLCEPYCEMNTAFIAFLKLYDPTNPTTFTYPAIELFGTQAFIGLLFAFPYS